MLNCDHKGDFRGQERGKRRKAVSITFCLLSVKELREREEREGGGEGGREGERG